MLTDGAVIIQFQNFALILNANRHSVGGFDWFVGHQLSSLCTHSVFCLLTNPRQLFADEHVDDAAPAEDGLHYDTAGAVIGRLTNPRSSFAKRMRLERCQCSVSIFRRPDADNP